MKVWEQAIGDPSSLYGEVGNSQKKMDLRWKRLALKVEWNLDWWRRVLCTSASAWEVAISLKSPASS
jgi:hypothetical protein